MSTRAPSLEIFEHLVAVARLTEAFAEARAILGAINARFGRIDAIAWKPSPACAADNDQLAEFATRFCAAFGELVVDPLFTPDARQCAGFAGVRRWVDTLFRVSAFGSSDHLLETIGRGADGEPWCFEGSAPQRFLLVWSPDSALKIQAGEWLAGQGAFAAPAFLAHVGARACLTQASALWRESLLELMPDQSARWRLDQASLGWIVEPWLHCSYAAGPSKHAIKAVLNRELRRELLAAGCVEMTAPPTTSGRKPTIVVTAEYFAVGHSVHRTHARAIAGLRETFHVVGMINPDQRGPEVDACFDDVIDLPRGDIFAGARAAASLILNLAPAIVFHVGVGLSARIIALAQLRLAPVQCASFGHAATTTCPAIDYFVLPDDFVGAPEKFSEKLLALPKDAFPYQPRREIPARRKPRGGVVHVAIPASLPKLNDALFQALAEIARRASAPLVFEFFPLGAAGLAHLELRLILANILPGAVVHPEMPHADYLDALASCDFFMSPFPYGNMNSIVDALVVGLPGVCLDGAEPHARADAALFARLGFPARWAASDIGQYIDAALALIDDESALASARALVAGIDWRARLCEGDDTLLGKALLTLLPRAI